LIPFVRRGIAPALAGCVMLLAAVAPFETRADEASTWPRTVHDDAGDMLVYQPQVESLSDNQLKGRTAFSFTRAGKTEPTFGVFWFTCHVATDRDSDLVRVLDIAITQSRFPESTPEEQKHLESLLQQRVGQSPLIFSLEDVRASLAATEQEHKSAADLKADPPNVVVLQEPAVLLLYDGEPKFQKIDAFERVINTPFLVVRPEGGNTIFLSGGGYWYSSTNPKGPWMPGAQPPADIAAMVPPDTSSLASKGVPAPKVIVATEPTELIVTTGKPDFAPLTGTDLLYCSNTENDLIRSLDDQQYYVLLSGRWFKGPSLSGPWTFVRPDSLPEDFALIPPSSPVGEVRASVPNTDESSDALADAMIPQTAAIKRDATITVNYDGEPKFQPVTGTDLQYAVNTSSTVLLVKGAYYCCDEGVWYVASTPKGPWKVSEKRPDEVDEIPASSPVYSVKYVYVYQTTPEYVYVGYTPAYFGWYPYYGCMWYGTGWQYPGWWGPYYYPRPCTYGFYPHWGPYTGWTYGMSWSVGFMRAGVAWGGYRPYYRPGGWYGPAGYRARPVPYNPVYVGHKVNTGQYYRNQYARAGTQVRNPRPTNLYNKGANRDRVANVPGRTTRPAATPSRRPNDVYADRQGNVYRRTPDSWEKRQNRSWQRDPSVPIQRPGTTPGASRPAPRPAPPGGTTRPSTPSARPAPTPTQKPSGLERDYQARQRSQSYRGGSAPRGGAPSR
jgi:hypothetical protein